MVRVAAAVGVVATAALASVHALPTLRREANVIDGNVFVREHSLVLMSPPDTPANADCLLGEWEPFGTCDAKTLTQLFVRKAQVVPQGNGAACEDVKATRPCKPVHCQMSEWSEWSDCVEGGYEIRTRKMIQAPLYGGRECPHDTDKVKCHPEDCVVCAWSDWTCDATSGKKTRTRRVARKAQLTGKPCPPLEQSRDCDPIDCVLDDGYEDEWTECDANGDKHRYRKVKVKPKYNGKECPKPEEVWDTQKQACPAVNCEEEDETTISFGVCQPGVDNKWFKTKVIGIKTYPKYGGTECRSVTERTKYETCEPEQCVMDEWQFEGECKENGKRKRTRKVKTQAKFGADECHDEEDEQPDPETCPPVNCEEEDESTTAFGECKQNDEDKKWYKTKTIGIKTQPKYGGKECRSEADRTITEACNPEQCAMSEWQFEGECKENGKRKRTRKVVSQGKNGADECHDEEDEQPDTEKCKPVDCEEFKSSEVPFGKCKLGKDKKWFKTKVLGIKKQPQYGGKPCQPENKRTFHTICHPVPCKMGDWKFEGTCDNDGKRKQVRKVEKQALYGAPTCRNEERRVVDATGCPPVDCVEFKESEVEFGPCEQKKGGQSFKTKVIGIKTEARNGGKACRPISERTIEVLCDRMS